MHASTFDYLKPTEAQTEHMARVRAAAKAYCDVLDAELPDGPDKTFIIRAHRSNAMWANVAITRHPDGAPRSDEHSAQQNAKGDADGSSPVEHR